MAKPLPVMWETQVQSLGWEDSLEKEMVTHFSTLAWKIPWMEEPGRLHSMGLQRVGNDWVISLSLSFLIMALIDICLWLIVKYRGDSHLLLYIAYSCPPPNFICLKSNVWCDGIRRWGLWEIIKSWGWSPHDRISALVRRTVQKKIFKTKIIKMMWSFT